MAIQEIHVPDIGDFDQVEIIEVLVSAGDTVAAEDSLITVESDKASMEIPSPASGVVKEVKVAEGDRVSEGSLILVMDVQEAAAEPAPVAPAPAAPTPVPAAPAPTAPKPDNTEVKRSKTPNSPTRNIEVDEEGFAKAYASPSVRKFARELGANLAKVSGSGRKGRITQDDVKAYIKDVMTLGQGAPAQGGQGNFALPPMPEIDFSQFGEIEEVKLSRINKLTGEFLHRNWLHIPHVTQFESADITEVEAFRKQMNEEAKKTGATKITPLVFIMKAMAACLKAYPRFNTSLAPNGETLIQKKYYHIGIAVDTPDGLVVPVIRDVDKKSISELSDELKEVSTKAREKKLKPSDMQGGSMSISSLGGIGGTSFTPIVNAPEVAILGVSKSEMKPVWNGKEFEPRLMLPMSLSFDHRVIDGADGARFTSLMATLMSDIRRLLV